MSCEPCPPHPPSPCGQVCPPPPPLPQCRPKPIMRGLHWAQTTRNIAKAFILSALAGGFAYIFGQNRRRLYKEFHERAEYEDWADEMARKGLFQSVPQESLKDNQHMKK